MVDKHRENSDDDIEVMDCSCSTQTDGIRCKPCVLFSALDLESSLSISLNKLAETLKTELDSSVQNLLYDTFEKYRKAQIFPKSPTQL